jgi:hypothetical protein
MKNDFDFSRQIRMEDAQEFEDSADAFYWLQKEFGLLVEDELLRYPDCTKPKTDLIPRQSLNCINLFPLFGDDNGLTCPPGSDYTLTGVHPEMRDFGQDQGERKINPQVPRRKCPWGA